MPRQESLLSFFRKDAAEEELSYVQLKKRRGPLHNPSKEVDKEKVIETAAKVKPIRASDKHEVQLSNHNGKRPSQALQNDRATMFASPSNVQLKRPVPSQENPKMSVAQKKTITEETSASESSGSELSREEPRVEAPLVPGTKRVRDDFGAPRKSADQQNKRQKLLQILGEDEDLKRDAWSEVQAKFDWLSPSKVLDVHGRRPTDPFYDRRSIQLPEDVLKKLSASQKQYWTTKAQYMDVVLFFKVGKFYELYELDAEIGHKELDWKMTVSGVGKCRQVGVPESGIDDAVQKLVARGYKVGRMEQIETSEQAKARRGPSAMVERKLVQVLTPSTLTEGVLKPEAIHLLALKEMEDNFSKSGPQKLLYGFAFADVAAGRFYLGSFCDNDAYASLNALLMQVAPQEILYELGGLSGGALKFLKIYCRPGLSPTVLTPLQPTSDFADASDVLKMISSRGYFQDYLINGNLTAWPKFFESIEHKGVAASALGALLVHLHRIKMDAEIPNGVVCVHEIYKGSMRLDGQTIVNLELLENTADGGKSGSLLGYLDSCMTSFGKRLLRRWICHPLQDVSAINRRLDAVEELLCNPGVAGDVRGRLRKLPDLERIVARIRGFSESSCFEGFLPLAKRAFQRRLKTLSLAVQGMQLAYEILNCLRQIPVTSQLLRAACDLLDVSAPREHLETGFASLKTVALSSEDVNVHVLEFNEHKTHWTAVVDALSSIDVLLAFAAAKISAEGPTCRPRFVSAEKGEAVLEMRSMWHPFATAGMGGAFVPNDMQLGSGKPRAMLLTGPNMGGKSTLLRATCLAALMAQMGCFVPCESCTLSPVDTIFTRIGARDRIMAGESTFMVECTEAGSILRHATSRSLVVLDELGRGTSTFDGYAIAYAVFRHLSENLDCRLLFATHYHPLTDEFSANPSVGLQHMACTFDMSDGRNQLVFLYKLQEGPCPRSYGLQVALLAGIPAEVVEAASGARKRLASRVEGYNSCSWSDSQQQVWLRQLFSNRQSYQSLLNVWKEVHAASQ